MARTREDTLRVELVSSGDWEGFSGLRMEMVTTTSLNGRRLFPGLSVRLHGLGVAPAEDPRLEDAAVVLELVPTLATRWSYLTVRGQGWRRHSAQLRQYPRELRCLRVTPGRVQADGARVADFSHVCLKTLPSKQQEDAAGLTLGDRKDNVIYVETGVEYTPHVHIVFNTDCPAETDHNLSRSPQVVTMPECRFIAVTAIRNRLVRCLKQDLDPAAKKPIRQTRHSPENSLDDFLVRQPHHKSTRFTYTSSRSSSPAPLFPSDNSKRSSHVSTNLEHTPSNSRKDQATLHKYFPARKRHLPRELQTVNANQKQSDAGSAVKSYGRRKLVTKRRLNSSSGQSSSVYRSKPVRPNDNVPSLFGESNSDDPDEERRKEDIFVNKILPSLCHFQKMRSTPHDWFIESGGTDSIEGEDCAFNSSVSDIFGCSPMNSANFTTQADRKEADSSHRMVQCSMPEMTSNAVHMAYNPQPGMLNAAQLSSDGTVHFFPSVVPPPYAVNPASWGNGLVHQCDCYLCAEDGRVCVVGQACVNLAQCSQHSEEI